MPRSTAAALIDQKIATLPDWRGQTMAEVRRIIREAVPDVTEEWKWMGTPTWSHNGILCICNAFKAKVKVTFSDGAKLQDVDGVFNAELGGKKWRAIDLFEGDEVNARGLRKLLLAAVALNAAKARAKDKAPSGTAGDKRTRRPAKAPGKTPRGTRTAPRRARADA